MTDGQRRWEMPTNERLALVEAETAQMRGAVLEIKEAVVSIKGTLDVVARMEERQLHLSESNERLHRLVETERDNRIKADKSLEAKMTEVSDQAKTNAYMRAWAERLALPLFAAAITYFLSAQFGV